MQASYDVIIALMTLGCMGIHHRVWVGHGTINFSIVVGRGKIFIYYVILPCRTAFLYTLLAAAVVGLERTFYQVSEDVGVVEVCVIVYSPTDECPIEFPFNVTLNTTDCSTGKRR